MEHRPADDIDLVDVTVKRVLLGCGALVAALVAYVAAIASLWYRDAE